MYLLLAGVSMVIVIIGLFWLKDRLQSPLLARVAYSELTARLAVIGAAISVIGLLLIVSDLAAAGTVHKWIDGDGITHYSDKAPAGAETAVIEIDVPAAQPAPAGTTGNYYSITRQWERMRRERIEREKLALQRARLEFERQASTPTVVHVSEPATSRTVSVLPFYLYRGPRHHRGDRKHGHRHLGGAVNPRSRKRADLGFFPHVD